MAAPENNSSGNILDYLAWRGDLSFAQDPFNEVDGLILSVLSYLKMQRFAKQAPDAGAGAPSEAAESAGAVPDISTIDPSCAVPVRDIAAVWGEDPAEDLTLALTELDYGPLLKAVAASRRLGDTRVFGYVLDNDDSADRQFAAVSFLVPDGTLFLSFMGTDASLTGWKEDFMLAYRDEIPAQTRALAYAREILAACPRMPYRIGGQSKGGNLAAWVGLKLAEDPADSALPTDPSRPEAEVQTEAERPSLLLLDVYSHDGPGFRDRLFDSAAYARIRDRFHSFVPAGSVIGTLLNHCPDSVIILSTGDNPATQHESFLWQVQGKQLLRADRTEEAIELETVIRNWIDAMSLQEREQFTENLVDLLACGGTVRALTDFQNIGVTIGALQSLSTADAEKKRFVTHMFRRFQQERWKYRQAKLSQTLDSALAPALESFQQAQKTIEEIFQGKEK